MSFRILLTQLQDDYVALEQQAASMQDELATVTQNGSNQAEFAKLQATVLGQDVGAVEGKDRENGSKEEKCE